MKNSSFIKLCWASLFVIYLVILAGSVVRATGSGMGCPDWPKCFGYLIPPTEEEQVIFQPNTEYKTGQVIIRENALWKARTNFTTGDSFQESDWNMHEKHDYAIFNPTHTWIEYVNRLLGALSGLFMLALFIYAVVLFAKKRLSLPVVLLSFLGVILLGFQAWLGRTVVDSHLEAAKITAHLFGAIALIAVILLIIKMTIGKVFFSVHKQVKAVAWLAFVLFFIQLLLGTEVRQLVDELMPAGEIKALFEQNAFKIHRSFSWLVLLSTLGMLYLADKKGKWNPAFTLLLVAVILEVAIGISLTYFGFPKVAQPAHLVLANILFGAYFWVILGRTRVPE